MKKYILLCLLAWFSASCSNFLEEYSQDLAKVESYKDLDEMLIGDGYWRPGTACRVDGYLEYSPYLLALHLMPDELDIYRKTNSDNWGIQEDFYGWITWQTKVGMPYKGTASRNEDDDWNELYKRINIANQIIGEIDKQEAANATEELEILRVKGEAYFLRAFYYFTLVNMYARPYRPETAANEAGIPLKLTQDVEDKEYESASVEGVYTVILSDLENAREALRQTPVKNHPYRADIVAAHLLTSRVCLYMQDWQHAYDHADSVINRKGELEDLHTYRSGNFLNRASVETVFSMGGHVLAPATRSVRNYPTFIMSDDMVELYGGEDDERDLRKGIYIRQMYPVLLNDKAGSPVWVFNKIEGYDRYLNGLNPSEVSDCYLMRTSEAYLNAAEAAAHLNKTEDAVMRLKELRRHRVNDDNEADYGTGNQLIDYIRNERARELLLEGHRWFDLRRYRVDNVHKYTKEITHYYTDFEAGNADGSYSTLRYVLAAEGEEDSYTLALPQEVTELQNTLPSVMRPAHSGVPYSEYAGIDMRQLGAEHGALAGKEAAEADNEAGARKNNGPGNNRYYDHFVIDYVQLTTYSEAYAAAFKEAYDENYIETEPLSAYKQGYLDGFDGGRYDLKYDEYEGDGYVDLNKNPYDRGTSEYNDYKYGFWDGYDMGFKSIEIKAKIDAISLVKWKVGGGDEDEGREKYYEHSLYGEDKLEKYEEEDLDEYEEIFEQTYTDWLTAYEEFLEKYDDDFDIAEFAAEHGRALAEYENETGDEEDETLFFKGWFFETEEEYDEYDEAFWDAYEAYWDE